MTTEVSLTKSRASTIDSELLSAQTYREFLSRALRGGHEAIPRGRLALIARKAEISRSFFSEILKGQKTLTTRTFLKICAALSLNKEATQFFALLAAVECDDVRELHLRLEKSEVRHRLEEVRSRLLSKNTKSTSRRTDKRILSVNVFTIYASLGTIDKGANFAEILHKSRVNPVAAQDCLLTMLNAGWIRVENERYYPTERTLSFEDLGENMGFLQALTESSIDFAKNAAKIASEESNLTFFSAVPVQASRINELKAKIRAAVLDIIGEFDDGKGSTIKKINLVMY